MSMLLVLWLWACEPPTLVDTSGEYGANAVSDSDDVETESARRRAEKARTRRVAPPASAATGR